VPFSKGTRSRSDKPDQTYQKLILRHFPKFLHYAIEPFLKGRRRISRKRKSIYPRKVDLQSKDLNTITNTSLLFISGGKRYLVTARGFSLISLPLSRLLLLL
jgi:hypothetical protein